MGFDLLRRSVIAGVFGFTGIAAGAAIVAKWLFFFIAVAVFAVLLILGLLAGEALFSTSAPISALRSAVIVSTACAAALLCSFLAEDVAAQGQCGDTVVVQRGDTLSSIAERCGVPERRLLSANRTVEGSEDLRVGMSLSLRSPEERAGERLESFARRAGEELSGLAREFGSSVEDLLNKNPDLKQRLRSLGDRLNIPGVESEKAKVSLSVESGPTGSPVTLSAIGLPANASVVIGAGPPRAAYEVLDYARTTADGTLRVTVRVPDWADPSQAMMSVVAAANDAWTVRSPRFDVTASRL
jgi:uncharacterized membrane protein YtjA (UPF0391 family)/LysM repeat protein